MMKRYGWDEIANETNELPEDFTTDGWFLVKLHADGVAELNSDRNHKALECRANSLEEAIRIFHSHNAEWTDEE